MSFIAFNSLLKISALKQFVPLNFLFGLILTLNWEWCVGGNFNPINSLVILKRLSPYTIIVALITAMLLLVLGLELPAQDSVNTYRPFSITYSTKDGLPSNQIIYLFNDSKGLMWIGTEQGVASFDGRNFKTYDNEELNNSLVTCITEDKNGVIWIATAEANIFLIDQGTVKAHPQNSSIRKYKASSPLQNFSLDSLGTSTFRGAFGIYQATMDSVYKISPYAKNGIVIKQFQDHLFASLEIVNHTSADSIVFQLPDTTFSILNNIPPIGGHRFYTIATDSSFAAAYGPRLYLYEKEKLTILDLPSRVTNSLIYAHDGSFWVATETKGVFHLKEGKVISNLFPNEKIHSIREDFEGGLWFGMPSEGVRYVPDKTIHVYSDSRPSKHVKYFFPYANNSLCWITRNLQLYHNRKLLTPRLSNGTLAFFQKGKFNDERSFCFSFEQNESERKLLCIDYNNLGVTQYNINLLNASQRFLVESGGDTLYISYSCVSDLKRESTIFNLQETTRIFLTDIVEYDSVIWLASKKGIHKATYHRTGDTLISTRKVIASDIWWARLMVINNSLFGVTNEGKLYEVNTKEASITLIDKSISGRSLTCFRIINNKAYLGFSDGIGCLTVNTQDDQGTHGRFEYLPVDISQFNSTIFDLEIIQDSLFLAFSDGIVSTSLTEVDDYFHPGKLSIDGLTYKNKSITDFTESLEFHTGENLSFHITAARFQNFPDFNYEYRLLPNDSIWRESKQSELNLFQLPANDYELQVRLNTDVHQSVAFSVSNYWYQQTWFIVLAAILATALGFLPFYYRIRLHTVAEEIEREKNNLRISTLTTQLKPHFIFNALNSIQAYMLEQNTSQATSYLAKFAKHIRATLELSREDTIPLEASLASLENYLVLERMRKNGAFDFQINVDKAIDARLIRIPPLLIQPYVENAIIHAFDGIHKGGLITISVDQLNHQFLSIKVRDNGVGLNRHIHGMSKNNEKKKSLGTLINAERIETLNALYNNQFSVSVDNAKTGNGVWVEILIPLTL